LATGGEVNRLSVKEANVTKNDELRKRFEYIKGILKGGDQTTKERSPLREDARKPEDAPLKKDSQGQGS